MANVEAVGSFASCKRCGKHVVKQFMKCDKCGNLFHQSCAKATKGVKVISDVLISCCGSDSMESKSIEPFFDALESVSVDNKVDISIFMYIVRQKDEIILGLHEKIKLLHDHINILNKYSTMENTDRNINSAVKSSKEAKTDTERNIDKGLKKGPAQKNKQQKVCLQSESAVNVPDEEFINHNKQLSSNLLKIYSESKCDEIINLTNDIHDNAMVQSNNKGKDDDAKPSENKWREVNGNNKKRKRITVGNNRDTSVKGVKKLTHLHVCRLHTSTSSKDLEILLRNYFPEARCEVIQSRYPDLYSSFKVSIFDDNFRKAMDPKLWPEGACISRFFLKRTPLASTK